MVKRFLLFTIIIIAAFITHAQIPTNGLVAYYPFNGNANDESVNGNNCIQNGAIPTTDRFNTPDKAYYFNGTGFLDGGSSVPPSLRLTNAVTVSAWVKLKTSNSLYNRIISVGNQNFNLSGFELFLENNVPRAIFGGNGGVPASVDYDKPLSFNEWHNLSFTATSNGLKLFLDGGLVASGPGVPITPPTEAEYIDYPFYIGKYLNPQYPSFFNGSLDDTRIYNRALTDTEISNIYNAEKPPIDIKSGLVAYYPFNGNANDESGNGKNGKINGGTFTTDRYNSAGKAMHFNGIDNHVDLNHSFGPFTEVSISAWVKTESGGNEIQAVLSSIGNEAFHFQVSDNGAYNIVVYTNNQSGLYPVLLPVLSNSPNNQWRHICATFKSGENKIFVNGALVSSSTHNFNFIESTSLLKIAAGWESERFFKGDIDDVKIYNRALSSSEILALFDNTGTSCSFTNPQIFSSQVDPLTKNNGALGVNANVKACPENINLTQFVYWFDNETANKKTINTNPSNYLNFTVNLDCENLTEGNHTLQFQFKDANNNLSEIISKPLVRTPMTVKEIVSPSISITRGVVKVGQIQKIKGKGFTPSAEVYVLIYNPNNELVFTQLPIVYYQDGSFYINLSIDNTFIDGEYRIEAFDVTTRVSTNEDVKFRVTNPTPSLLTILEPSGNTPHYTEKEISVKWRDFVKKDITIGNQMYVLKRYKIEQSNDNGSSWSIIYPIYEFPNAIPDRDNSQFFFNHTVTQPGSIKFRITDVDNPLNTNISAPITFITNPGNGFITSLEWDHSSPTYSIPSQPSGLAADSVSRVFVKVKKRANSIGVVSQIKVSILMNGVNSDNTNLLGKIAYTANHSGYNLDANAANKTTATHMSDLNEYWFCLVAPNDFTSDQLNLERVRKLDLKFEVDYLNLPQEQFVYSDIEIVRPPLMMVHGINGNAASFDNSNFNLGSGKHYFNNDHHPNPLWVIKTKVTLLKYGSYYENAEILLDNNSNPNYGNLFPNANSFQWQLEKMHRSGYACNRVDYVCHSMGGCVARTAMNLFEDKFRPSVSEPSVYRNYGAGFINKFITVNTPHNGSYIPDFFIGNFSSITEGGKAIFLKSINKLDGFFDNINQNLPSKALIDLQAFNGGVTLKKTEKLNAHLIGSDIDKENSVDVGKIDFGDETAVMYGLLKNADLGLAYGKSNNGNKISNYISDKFKNNEYWNNTDGVVPVSSQLPGRDLTPITGGVDIITESDFLGLKSASIIYGKQNSVFNLVNSIDASTITHTEITDNPAVGNRIMVLLNSPIHSSRFTNEIPANPNQNGRVVYRSSQIVNISDSTLYYPDTLNIKIITPSNSKNLFVDSTISISIKLKDTFMFRNIKLLFQGNTYISESKVENQIFKIKVQTDVVGNNEIRAIAIYDSAGFILKYYDSVLVVVKTSSSLDRFSVSPTTQFLNRNQTFNYSYQAYYDDIIAGLNTNIDSLQILIADTNVVRYDSLNYRFIAKDTGTTFITFDYKGFKDTAYVFLSSFFEGQPKYCTGSNILFVSIAKGEVYQWQVDIGNGYENIINNSIYTGANTDSLQLVLTPSSMYGYKYRCLATSPGFISTSKEYILKFSNTWTGMTDSDWQKYSNWECSLVPDEYVDVIIPSGKQHYPTISNNTKVHSIVTKPGASVSIKAGINLEIKGK